MVAAFSQLGGTRQEFRAGFASGPGSLDAPNLQRTTQGHQLAQERDERRRVFQYGTPAISLRPAVPVAPANRQIGPRS
jgi:hypothetical protein